MKIVKYIKNLFHKEQISVLENMKRHSPAFVAAMNLKINRLIRNSGENQPRLFWKELEEKNDVPGKEFFSELRPDLFPPKNK